MADEPQTEANQERYTHGYGVASQVMATRSAGRQAGFFLPHLRSGMSLLDCGCGPGTITLGLAEALAPGEVVGIDIGAGEIERATTIASEQGVANVRFEVANSYQLPFADSTFDAVFAHTLLEHLVEPDKALSEMLRVLRTGGVIGVRDSDWGGVVISPHDEAVLNFFKVREQVWRLNGGDPRLGRRLAAMLRAAGFNRVQTTASYNMYGNFENAEHFGGVENIGEFFARYAELPQFTERAQEHGYADAEELRGFAKASRSWGRHPDALWAYSNFEAVGWKA
ncbi:MAG: methyltransferase domain-containing protein [Chloroflexi bacterium]|nr:methyltransferase domain-containing protein [Chloroflexota bacterium]